MANAGQQPAADPKIAMLRHATATLAYRAGKTLRNAPESFADFRVSADARAPGQILAHMGDLLDWGLSIIEDRQTWHDSAPLPWPEEVARFHAALERFDAALASASLPDSLAEKIFQGPIADALTHTGQIAMLRRLAGVPVRGENYFVAEIAAGRLGPQQAAPRREFD